MRRFQLDTATGSSDLAWMLVLLFFITAFVGVRSSAFVSEVSADEGPSGDPIVIDFAGDAPRITAPSLPAGPPSLAWLDRTCRDGRIDAVVQCPPDATHVWCQQRLRDLMTAAPTCTYRY